MYFVYVYYIDEEPLYVGESKNPYRRHNEHLYERRIFEKATRIDLCKFETYKEAKYFEKYYTSCFNPLLNKRNNVNKSENHGAIHHFVSYSIDDFVKEFVNYKDDEQIKENVGITFQGKIYKSESQLIRELIKGENVKNVRHLRNRVMKKYECNITEAYELIIKYGVDYFGKKREHNKIDDFIINNQNLSIKQIATKLNESYDRIQSRRVDLISKGIISIKNNKHS